VITNLNDYERSEIMKETKIYTREDIRNLWRQYQRGHMTAGNDFALIAYAQGQDFKTFKAEIERECHEQDEQLASKTNVRATPKQRRRAGIRLWEKAVEYKQREPELSDRQALRLVLMENPILAEQYTGFPTRRAG
jgi:hypothetical protein